MGRVKADKEPRETSSKLLKKLNEKSGKIQKRKSGRFNDSFNKSHNRSSFNDSVSLVDEDGEMAKAMAPHGKYINFQKYGNMSPWYKDTSSSEKEKEEGKSKSKSNQFLDIIKEEAEGEEEGEVQENKVGTKYSDEKDIEKKSKKIESPDYSRGRRLRSPPRFLTPRRKDSSRDFISWRTNRRRSQSFRDRRSVRSKPRREIISEPIERWGRDSRYGSSRSFKPRAVINPGPTEFYHGYAEGPRRNEKLRPIVIDASNVAMLHSNDRYFSVAGIELVVRDLQARGHQVTAFLPQHERKNKHPRDQEKLEKLYGKGILKFTNSRDFKGERITSHDDSFILDNAAMTGAVVVTRDQFRDLTGKKPEWDEVIRNRLLPPVFVGYGEEERVQWPNDPMGPGGPNLDDFLRI